MLKKLLLGAVLFLSAALGAAAQGTHYENILLNQAGKPVVNAGVYVCTAPATGSPCSPAAIVYSDITLTTVKTQPIKTGPLGNYDFYVAPNTYVVSIIGPSITVANDTITVACTSGSSCGGGGGSGPTIQTNGSANSSQTTANFVTSTSNVEGLTLTPSNPAGGIVKYELSGGAYAGTASNLSGTPALPNGTTATTQSNGDNTSKLATDQFVIANSSGGGTSLIYATAFGVKANAHFLTDCATTATSPIITCPNADSHFLTTATAGQTVFVTNGCAFQGGPPVMAETTILTVSDDTHITANANAGSSVNPACVAWGDLDELSNGTGHYNDAWNAVTASLAKGIPTALFMPCGASLIEGAIGPSGSYTSQAGSPSIVGCGGSGTTFVGTPNFGWTSCTTACFFLAGTNHGPADPKFVIRNLNIFGMGLDSAGVCPASNKVLFQAYSAEFFDYLTATSWCSTLGHNLLPLLMAANAGPEECDHCVFDYVGGRDSGIFSPFAGVNYNVAVLTSNGGYPITLRDTTISDGGLLEVTSAGVNGVFNSYAGNYQSACIGVLVGSNNVVANFYGDNSGGISVAGAGVNDIATIHGGVQWGDNCGAEGDIDFGSSGSTVRLSSNVQLPITNTIQNTVIGTGNLILEGTEVITTGTVGFAPSTVNVSVPGSSVNGACSGTASSSQTLGLYNTGANETTPTCTSTTIGTGIVASAPGTLKYLIARAGTGGVSGSSGVVTVLKNGSTTTITCTLGTGLYCQDVAHSVSYTTGDRISLQFTTQGSETLANVNAEVWPLR